MTMTGEGICPSCGKRVLVARKWDDGQLIRLEPELTDGGWTAQADATGIVLTTYKSPRPGVNRIGHQAHDLRCARDRSLMQDSRDRIAAAMTEPVPPSIREREAMMAAARCDDAGLLPVPSPAGLRALVGASS